MKRKRMLTLFALVLVFALTLSACNQNGNEPKEPNEPGKTDSSLNEDPSGESKGDVIRIGIAAPLTGTNANYGGLMVDGAQIAIDEVNANGGINGSMLELVPLDDKQDPSEAALVAQRFADDESITAVIAHGNSTNTLAAGPIYEAAKVPFISPSSNNPTITEQGWDYYVRLGLRDDRLSPQVIAMIVNNLGIEKLGVLYANNDYGVGNLEAAQRTAEMLGAEVLAQETYTPGMEKDYSTIINKMQRSEVEGVITYMDHADAGLYFGQAHEWDFSLPTVGQSALTYQQLIDLAGVESLQNLHICVTFNPYSERDTVVNFMEKFHAIRPTEVPSEPCAGSYDIVKIIAQALGEGATKDNLAQWIKNTTSDKDADKLFVMEEGCTLKSNMVWDEKGDIQPFHAQVLIVDEEGNFVTTDIEVDLEGTDLGF